MVVLQPDDWLKTFLSVFDNDTKYDFANQTHPDKNILKSYSVVLAMPKSLGQVPAIWVSSEGFETTGESATDFLHDFAAFVDVYGVCHGDTRISYDNKIWAVPGINAPKPTDNLLFLLLWYIGKKVEDNPEIVDGNVSIHSIMFVNGEFFPGGIPGIRNSAGVRVGYRLEVEID